MDKKCSKCGNTKDINEFSRHGSRKDGRDPHCKECKKKYWYKNRDALLKQKREYYNENRDKLLESHKLYMKTESAKKSKYISFVKYRNTYPEKKKARDAISTAVRSKKIQPANFFICSICKSKQAEHYHHHKGYEQKYWMDVIPVCSICHNVIE